MKNNKSHSLLNILKVAMPDQVKVFSISPKILRLKGSPLSIPLKKILSLSMQRIAGLRNRVVLTDRFFKLVLSLKRSHGDDFTIKWLKACYVALQKAQAGDNLPSLRSLEPGLPLPRLINGLPAFILKADRLAIKRGHASTIRFWSSLLSVYRVLKCSYKLKTSTITDPYSGNPEFLEFLKGFALSTPVFGVLEGFKPWHSSCEISPRTFIMSSKASPTAKRSWTGLLMEIWQLFNSQSGQEVLINLRKYLEVTTTSGLLSDSRLWQRISDLKRILTYISVGSLQVKKSFKSSWGQLALKEEAAGKLRVFALVDSITQSTLAPLHESMFSLLELIPNDGTFNQTASIARSREKAAISNCAYSYDLSAATDRLPAPLTASIISNIFGVKGLGDAWLKLLVERDFYLGDKSIKDYGNPETPQMFRYSIGQPMGALSSWAGLAITHHFLLQYCSLTLPGRVGWETQYEILGDDLVVFDPLLAKKYLEVMELLGVGINLTKSIVSPDKPVFEFAKRTFNSGIDVSPIPFKQLLGSSLADRVSQYLAYGSRGLLTSKSLLQRALSRFGSLQLSVRELANPVLSSLGALVSQKLIPHRWLVESLIEPIKTFEFSQAKLKIPLVSSLKLILALNPLLANVLNGSVTEADREFLKALAYPWSKEEIRKEVYSRWVGEFKKETIRRITNLLTPIAKNYSSISEGQVLQLFSSVNVKTSLTQTSMCRPDRLEFIRNDPYADWLPEKEDGVTDTWKAMYAKALEAKLGKTNLLQDLMACFEENLIARANQATGGPGQRVDLDVFNYAAGTLGFLSRSSEYIDSTMATEILERVEPLYNSLVLAEPPKAETKKLVIGSASVLLNLKKLTKGALEYHWDIFKPSEKSKPSK